MSLPKIVITSFIALWAAVLLFATADEAEPKPQQINRCGPKTVVARFLLNRFKERPVAGGYVGSESMGNRLMIVASPNGTWTVLMWLQGDLACPIASGTGFWIMPQYRKARAWIEN